MRAEIISVGTELLLGQIADTNAQYLAQSLPALGIDLFYVSQVGDNQGRVVGLLRQALNRSDLVIMTGGLGPTEDDLTRESIAEALGEEMNVDQELATWLRDRFRRLGRPMPERNLKQATLIPSARALPNPIGTAPGWWVEKGGKIIVAMPGVPREMTKMWDEQAVPRLRSLTGSTVILSRTLKVTGLGESQAEQALGDLTRSANPTLATYAKRDGVHLRLTAKADREEAARELLDQFEPQVRARIADYIYGTGDDTLSGVIGRVLRDRGLTLATMESASGGLLASEITDTPGSSSYYKGGLVAYTPEMKLAHGVPREIIDRYGPVSAETTQAMATAARERLGADVGLATTGVAGPEPLGDIPAGTLHVAIDFCGRIRKSQSGLWTSTREVVKRRLAMDALNLLWRTLRQDATLG